MKIENFSDQELREIMGNPSATAEEVAEFREILLERLERESLEKELELMHEADFAMAFHESSKAEPNKSLALRN